MAIYKVYKDVNGEKQVVKLGENNILDHNQLDNRNAYGSHSISAIRNLPEKLTQLKTSINNINVTGDNQGNITFTDQDGNEHTYKTTGHPIDEETIIYATDDSDNDILRVVGIAEDGNIDSDIFTYNDINNIILNAQRIKLEEIGEGKLKFTSYDNESNIIQGGFLPDNYLLKLIGANYILPNEYEENKLYYIKVNDTYSLASPQPTQDTFPNPNTIYYIPTEQVLTLKQIFTDTDTILGTGLKSNHPLSVCAVKQIITDIHGHNREVIYNAGKIDSYFNNINLTESDSAGKLDFTNAEGVTTQVQGGFLPDEDTLELENVNYTLATTYNSNEIYYMRTGEGTEQNPYNYIVADPQPSSQSDINDNPYYIVSKKVISLKKVYVDSDTLNGTGSDSNNSLSVKAIKDTINNTSIIKGVQDILNIEDDIGNINQELQALGGKGGYLIPYNFNTTIPNMYTETTFDDDATDRVLISTLGKMFNADGEIVDFESGSGELITTDAIEYDAVTNKATSNSILSLLTQYALSQISNIDNPVDIWNGTKITNTSNDHTWVLNNTPDTNPKIFEWVDLGHSTISIASNNTLGIVKGSNSDLYVSVNSSTGEMTVNNLAEKLDDKQDVLTPGDNILITTETENNVTTTTISVDSDNILDENSNKPIQNAPVTTALSNINLTEGNNGKLTFTDYEGNSIDVQGGFLPDGDTLKLSNKMTLATTFDSNIANDNNKGYYTRTGGGVVGNSYVYTKANPQPSSQLDINNGTYYFVESKVISLKQAYTDNSIIGKGTIEEPLEVNTIILPKMIFVPESNN